jgi:lipoprotein signal peptidase
MTRHWTDNFKSPLALLLFFGVAIVGAAADLWTKSLAVAQRADAPPYRFIPGWVHLTYTENHGAVFGIAQGARPIFLAVSVGAIIFLAFLFMTSGRSRVYQAILGLLLAGVVGNMYDRVQLGYVRDMIHALPGWSWPQWLVEYFPRGWQPAHGQAMEVFPWIFNLADTYLCVGVTAMLLYSFVAECFRKRAAAAAEKALVGKQQDPDHPCLDAPAAERT